MVKGTRFDGSEGGGGDGRDFTDVFRTIFIEFGSLISFVNIFTKYINFKGTNTNRHHSTGSEASLISNKST